MCVCAFVSHNVKRCATKHANENFMEIYRTTKKVLSDGSSQFILLVLFFWEVVAKATQDKYLFLGEWFYLRRERTSRTLECNKVCMNSGLT